MAVERPLVVFVSDIHLTDALHGSAVPKAAAFERFWVRIQGARGARPAILAFVGDLFDLVRSPRWFEGRHRPYHEPSREMLGVIESIVDAVLEREAAFFDAIRAKVETGALEVQYALGNHDRLLRHAPQARRRIWKALTGRDENVEFPPELLFEDHGVLAYHGHVGDPINHDRDGAATIGDAIGSELITRFPLAVRAITGERHPMLDDIDDVRPVYAVPSWVRHLGVVEPALLSPVHAAWVEVVESFLSERFVRHWMKQRQRRFGLDTGKKLRLMLELSTKRIIAKGSDKRLTEAYGVMQHAFDGKMAQLGAEKLAESRGLRYVVNGHSHFSAMRPIGTVDGKPAVYFNTGTWRSVHQIGHGLGGRPTFLPYDAMSYLVFFPDGDELGRDFEWWNGALVSR
ncbi:MAG: metallophosphoesterase [Sandaracinaceae bacterium]|nr:metallophosphoesterase [Sandaracinaceae bacterium]